MARADDLAHGGGGDDPLQRGARAMQSDTFVDAAASVAVVAAVAGLLYARASAHAAREAADAARRSMELAERSRQSAARARLRGRASNVWVSWSRTSPPRSPVRCRHGDLSQDTKAQCRVLHRARQRAQRHPAEVGGAAPGHLGHRARRSCRRGQPEIDGVLKKLTAHRPLSAYRPRHQVPWNRPAGARSGAGASAGAAARVTRPPSP